MIGCQGMKVPSGKVVAPTYSATSTGSAQTPNQLASLAQNPFSTGCARTSPRLVEASQDLIDVLDTRASSVESVVLAIRSPTPSAVHLPIRCRMVPANPKMAIRMAPASQIEVILTVVVQTALNCPWAAAVTAVVDYGRSRSR
jgi:hypothetical protein